MSYVGNSIKDGRVLKAVIRGVFKKKGIILSKEDIRWLMTESKKIIEEITCKTRH